MEGNQQLLLILLGLLVIVGFVSSIAYYFARYGTKGGAAPADHEAEKEGPESSSQAFEPAAKVTSAQKTVSVDTKSEAAPPVLSKPVVAEKPVALDQALAKTRAGLWGRMSTLLGGAGRMPAEIKEELEEILYTSDLGVPTVEKLMEIISERLSRSEKTDSEQVRLALKTAMLELLNGTGRAPAANLVESIHLANKPTVLLMVGVNGVGKTTTIGKIAFALAQSGRRVLVAAGDTFRAAAGAQLKVWSERAQVEIFAPDGVSDPAAVAYSAVERAKGQGFDVVMIDTAGRLHTQAHLMEELKKVKRVLTKLDAGYPHETLLVLDANSGQNAIVQAREFNKALELTGVILTKMDGTAKGGVALSLAQELGLPPRLIGVGEKVEDLRPFSPQEYVNAIL